MKIKFLLYILPMLFVSNAHSVIIWCGGGDCHGNYTEGNYNVSVSSKNGIKVYPKDKLVPIETIYIVHNPNPKPNISFQTGNDTKSSSNNPSHHDVQNSTTEKKCTWERSFQDQKTKFLSDCYVFDTLKYVKENRLSVLAEPK